MSLGNSWDAVVACLPPLLAKLRGGAAPRGHHTQGHGWWAWNYRPSKYFISARHTTHPRYSGRAQPCYLVTIPLTFLPGSRESSHR